VDQTGGRDNGECEMTRRKRWERGRLISIVTMGHEIREMYDRLKGQN
jgi:hypothetical protein